eukprot:1748940-Lingulodinium_polyedra.AAC.1
MSYPRRHRTTHHQHRQGRSRMLGRQRNPCPDLPTRPTRLPMAGATRAAHTMPEGYVIVLVLGVIQ